MRTRSKRAMASDAWWLMARFTLDRFQRGDHAATLREHGLTPGHLKTLAMLDPDDPRPMGVMAEMMRCDASQVTWLVDRLEERGMVERRPSPSDRRVKTIALTAEGAAFRDQLMEDLLEPPPELLAMDAPALEALCGELSKLPEPAEGLWSAVGRARRGRGRRHGHRHRHTHAS